MAPLAGDRLPTERDLAARIGCSRQTLRGDLAMLEQEGEIRRHVGQGTFRGPPPRGHPIRENVLMQTTSPRQLMQARLMTEPPIAAEAARIASGPDIAYLRDLVARGREAGSRSDSEQADARFHRGIAEVAGNPVLLGLLDYLAGARRRAAWQREWNRVYRRFAIVARTHGATWLAVEDPARGGAQPLLVVGDHQLDAAQVTVGQRARQVGPER